MQKNQTVMNSSYAFSLVALKPDCHYKTVSGDFTPPITLNKASNSIVPGYLLDNNFFTQAFIIPRERQQYESTQAVERAKFNSRIQKANQLDEDLPRCAQEVAPMAPPVPTTKYCQVCKCTYKEYEDHLNESSHQRQARFSKANSYISQLVKVYYKKGLKTSAKAKSKGIEKQTVRKDRKKPKNKKSPKERPQNGLGTKHNNCSTNIPSVLPTPCC